MKLIQKLILSAVLLAGTASISLAGEGAQYWQTLRHESQFAELKPGDKVVVVCAKCRSISEITVNSTAEAMALAKDGGMVTCPACHAQAKVRVKANGNSAPALQDVTYENEKGEEFMFIAKVGTKS